MIEAVLAAMIPRRGAAQARVRFELMCREKRIKEQDFRRS
jgi:hypothetical protein